MSNAAVEQVVKVAQAFDISEAAPSRISGRAQLVRRELLALTWLFATAVGTTILLWNRSFVALWVSSNHYAGSDVDLLIVLIAVQTAFIRSDAYIIDAALQSWLRVVISAAAAVLTVSLAIPLTRAFGLTGSEGMKHARKMLAINPNDRQAKTTLEKLGSKP